MENAIPFLSHFEAHLIKMPTIPYRSKLLLSFVFHNILFYSFVRDCVVLRDYLSTYPVPSLSASFSELCAIIQDCSLRRREHKSDPELSMAQTFHQIRSRPFLVLHRFCPQFVVVYCEEFAAI